MSDVRADIKRAMKGARPDPLLEAAKGVAVIGGGLTVGALVGRRIARALSKRDLAKNAMDHVKLGDAVLKPDNFDRFKSAVKARRK